MFFHQGRPVRFATQSEREVCIWERKQTKLIRFCFFMRLYILIHEVELKMAVLDLPCHCNSQVFRKCVARSLPEIRSLTAKQLFIKQASKRWRHLRAREGAERWHGRR